MVVGVGKWDVGVGEGGVLVVVDGWGCVGVGGVRLGGLGVVVGGGGSKIRWTKKKLFL